VSPASRADDRAATAAALLAGGLVGQQVAGKAIRDSLFLSAFRVSWLPGMMMLSAFASAAAGLLFARAMGRRSPSRVMLLGLASAAALFLGEWWLALTHTHAAAVAVYLHLSLFGPALVSGLWSLVNERFDPHAAKGIVGRIGAGGSVGAVAGGLMTWLAAGRTSVPTMLIGLAVVNAASLLGLRWLRLPVGERPPAAREDLESPATGLRALREFPYLRNLALLVGLASFTEILIDYVFKAEAAARLTGSGELIGFFGPFYTGLAGLALVVQGLFSRPCLERLGLAGTVALHPLATAAGSALALLRPGLGSAVVARGSNGVLRDSLFRSGYELLYTPLPPQRKRATKAVIDVAADKVGAIAGAAVAMFLVAATPTGDQALLALALLGSLAALAVARWLHQGYVAALRESLRSGIVHFDLSDAVDVTTRATLTESLDRQSVLSQIEALRGGIRADSQGEARGSEDPLTQTVADLRSSRPDRIRHAIRKARPGDPALVPHLLPLLARSEVLADVLRYLRGCVPKCTGQVLDALLDAESPPTVRRRVPRVLKSCTTQRAVDGLVLGLDDPVFQVRAECGLVLSHLRARGPDLRIPGEAVFPRVVRELASMEEERSLEHAFTLLGLVLEREPLLISFRALRGEDRRLRGTALEYLENVLPDPVRQRLFARIGPEPPRAAPARPRGEVESELLQSVSGLSRSRLGLKPARRA
jgi:hypothetical protein